MHGAGRIVKQTDVPIPGEKVLIRKVHDTLPIAVSHGTHATATRAAPTS